MSTGTTSSPRGYLIACRWVSVISCGGAAAASLTLFEPVVRRAASPLVDRLSSFDLVGLVIVTTIPAVALIWAVGGKRWRGFLGVRYFITYPPLWVAVVLGVALCLLSPTVVGKPIRGDELGDIKWLVTRAPIWGGAATFAVLWMLVFVYWFSAKWTIHS